ncbi:uncharacterized protein METZ01_LOCUS242045 [marine metagenome]|uniref:Uncharacterized protein n=1 Tax=marine metagenome TaxID=408172 RepID=A0A382HRT2_9ZZZZ
MAGSELANPNGEYHFEIIRFQLKIKPQI